MKKFLLSSLLIIMISLVWAESHFLDMRVGDFGCITRVVFEFTGKINYSVQEEDSNLSVSISSLKEGKIQLPIEESNNIDNITIKEETGSAQIELAFSYPIEVTSYNYFQENKNYIIVLDIYDRGYQTDKEKGLATILFKAQKFPLSKISSELNDFSEKYEADALVNFYLGRLFATKQMKTIASDYFSKIDSSSEHFFTAQAYIDNLNKNRFPTEEVKPDFLLTEEKTDEKPNIIKEEVAVNEKERENKIEKEKDITVEQKEKETVKKEVNQTKAERNKFWYLYLIISLLVIIFQFIQAIKKKFFIKELNAKLESSVFELKALENKLEKGVVINSKTKEKIIIKLYNSGWKSKDIADELNTPIEIIEATISKEGRL